jgi:NAD-dependent deacetylase
MNLEYMRNAVKRSNNMVCLMGRRVSLSTGCDSYGGDEFAYEVEEKYGYSPEEIFTSAFYNTRPGEFFEYYKAEILAKRGRPNECHATLARMEKAGKLKAIITRGIFNLASRGGCQNVICLHGNIYENSCPRCRKSYSIEDIMNADGVPICESCGAVIRPQICLHGEMLDNMKMTQAAKAIGEADTLLVLGCALKSELCDASLKYFQGDTIILINDEPHFSDYKADYHVIGRPKDILPKLYP